MNFDVESVKELVVCVRDLTIAFRAFIPPMTSPTSDHSVDVTRHQLSASTYSTSSLLLMKIN